MIFEFDGLSENPRVPPLILRTRGGLGLAVSKRPRRGFLWFLGLFETFETFGFIGFFETKGAEGYDPKAEQKGGTPPAKSTELPKALDPAFGNGVQVRAFSTRRPKGFGLGETRPSQ